MQASFHGPVAGYLAFCAVKLVGYTIAGFALARTYRMSRNPFVVGPARTLLGMLVGAAYWGLVVVVAHYLEAIVPVSLLPYIAYPIGLIPVRIAEWWVLIALFFRRRPRDATRRDWIVVLVGTLWSFLLDLPATLGFLKFGDVHVC